MTEENKPADETQAIHSTTHDLTPEAKEALVRLEAEQKAGLASDISTHTGLFHVGMRLKIAIGNAPDPMIISINGDAVIGRRDPATNYVPDVDLTDHAAYRLGVSRRHAILRLERKQLQLIDLGSRNGTYLNGTRVTAQQKPQKLHDGDLLRIGKIVLRLSFLQND